MKPKYADPMLRATFPKQTPGIRCSASPKSKPLAITVPVGYGYILTQKRPGGSLAVVDVEFCKRKFLSSFPGSRAKTGHRLTANTTYYSDATLQKRGTHGVDTATGNSFVLSSIYVIRQRLSGPGCAAGHAAAREFLNDPLHDPLFPRKPQHGRRQVTGFRVGCACPQFLREIRPLWRHCRSFNVTSA